MQDTHGGVNLYTSMYPHHRENLDWLTIFRSEYDKEKLLRTTNPTVAAAWEQYQVAVNLCRD
jgi:hypothetical protein